MARKLTPQQEEKYLKKVEWIRRLNGGVLDPFLEWMVLHRLPLTLEKYLQVNYLPGERPEVILEDEIPRGLR